MNTYCIAELGSNHNGDLDRCRELIHAAKYAGFNAVKLQWGLAKTFIHRSGEGPHLNDFPFDWFEKVRAETRSKGLDFGCTLLTLDWARRDVLNPQNPTKFLDFLKVGSYELTWLDLMEALSDQKTMLFVSTGMATFYEIEMALTVLRSKGEGFLTLMHCCSQYPDLHSRPEDVFSSIQRLSEKFGYPVGYSDHTTNAECIVAAVDAGAVAVEMHFDLKDEKGAESEHSIPANEAAEIIARLNPDWRERAWRRSPEDGFRPMPWIR